MISNQKNKPKTNILEKTYSCIVLDKDENTEKSLEKNSENDKKSL